MKEGDEIRDVVVFLGRENDLEGALRDKHLAKILDYMIQTQYEDYTVTLGKLAFKTGINQRYIKENYLLGMEFFNLIEVSQNGGKRTWRWKGVPVESVNRKQGIKISVKDIKMCNNCAKKKPDKTCIQDECKNIKEYDPEGE